MPVIKSAAKKLRQDKKREIANNNFKKMLKDAILKTKKDLNVKNLSNIFKLTDKAAKKHIIHKNKAARIKSTLSKMLDSKSPKKESAKVATKSAAKKTVKK